MRTWWKRAKRRHYKRHNPTSTDKSSLYEPLPSDSSIRLITLQPGNFNDPIRCTLEVFQLASVPPYEAISYVWGDPTPRNQIRCNERRHLIGDNLYDALRNVRLENEPRIIWVDALCINQANLGERSHQVLLMRNIYSQARKTLICLDIKPSIDPDEVHWTDIAYEAILIITNWSERNSFPSWHRCLQSDESDLPPLQAKHADALKRLFSCKWFCRVWIIQESVLSPESVFIVNQREWTWSLLGVTACRLFEYASAIDGLDISAILSLSQCNQIWRMIFQKKDGSNGTLFSNMIKFRSALATDPRDLIYGLLGVSQERSLLEQQMGNDVKPPIPLPNYKDSLSNVFADWGRYFIESSGNLEILSRTLVCGTGSPYRLDFIPHG